MAACPVLGFAVQVELSPAADSEEFWRAFTRLLESRGLQSLDGSECAPVLSWLISSEGGQATELDREATIAWLHARSEIADHGVGPLVDLERTAEA